MIVKTIKSFFNNDTRSSKYKKNVILLAIIPLLNVLLSLLLIPLSLTRLGLEEYGVWITLTGIVSWFAFFDFGLGNGLRNKYAVAKAQGDTTDVRQYVSTAFIGLVIISSSIFLFFLIASFFMDWAVVLNAPQRLKSDLTVLALFVIGSFCLKLIVNIVCVLLTADQEPAIPALIGFYGGLLAACSIYLITVFLPPSLLYIGIALTVSQIFPLVIAFFYYFGTRYKPILPSLKYFSRHHIKSIFSLGLRFFFIQLTAMILFQTNNFIIAHTCGLNEVAEFNIAYKYINMIYIIFSASVTPLWSASTEAYVKNEIDWIKKSIKQLNYLLLFFIATGIFLILVSSFIYQIWFKSIVKPNPILLWLLLLYTVCLCRTLIYRSFMNGVGKITLQFYVTTIQSFLHIPLAYYLGKIWGIYGIIAVMLLWAIMNIIWEPIQFRLIITKSAKGIWNK